ncbi:MAG: winged helix DNA-binding domain-containing protein, partial [Brucellaceae bacterium]|nr:winged helix DNA-binding domain-containing protein [Brucellaceae bacterium]
RVRVRRLKPVSVENDGTQYWAEPQVLDALERDADPDRVHILSPFDPLIIQRKRTAALLGYDHVFEAYVPAAKRQFGYFTLPVLAGDEIVAALDLKADRQAKTLLVQAWHWVGPGDEGAHRQAVETALHDFEQFQFRDA